jgi:hypothetical protein
MRASLFVALVLLTAACGSPLAPSSPQPVVNEPRLVVRVIGASDGLPKPNVPVRVNGTPSSTNVVGECDWLIVNGRVYTIAVDSLPVVSFTAEGPITWTFQLP